MKKIIKSVILLALVLMVGCNKKDETDPNPQNCAVSAGKVSEAAALYGSKLDKASCENYKKAVRDYVNSCSLVFSAADKKSLDDALAEPCPN